VDIGFLKIRKIHIFLRKFRNARRLLIPNSSSFPHPNPHPTHPSFRYTSSMTTPTSTAPLRTFYPPIEPFETGFLSVTDGHTLYYEISGNPTGKNAVFLHGGPGSGVSPKMRQVFDPAVYRITLFDQRGAGKSTPFASLENNTVHDLVEDIERLRKHLSIDKWLVFGGCRFRMFLSSNACTGHPSMNWRSRAFAII